MAHRCLRQCLDLTSQQAEGRVIMIDARSTATMPSQLSALASADDAASQIGALQRWWSSFEQLLTKQSSWS